MKKGWIIGIVIAVILLLGIAVFAFKILFGSYYVNNSLLTKYPGAKYVEFRNYRISDFSSLYQNGTITSNGKTLYYDSQKREFSCNGDVKKLIAYSGQSAPKGMDGGWGNKYVIDCDDAYWLYGSGSSNPFAISGPFLFDESSDTLKQKAQEYFDCTSKINSGTIEQYNVLIDVCISESF